MKMADLRITGVTNNQLELQAPDGTRHYLEISPDLLKAMKSRPAELPPTLTPREIQAEIRLGTTVAELVARTGADEDQVAKYAAPIITELKHIVTLARNIRLSLAGDRFTDPTQIEFGTVMDERLVNNRAKDVSWVSKKTVEGVWLVSAEYKIDSEPGIATWSFEPKALSLVPENQSALLLSNASPLSLIESTPKIKTEQVMHPTVSAAQPETLEEETQPVTTGLSVVPELIEEVPAEQNQTEVITVIETETRATFHVVDDVQEDFESEDIYSQEREDVAEELFVEETEVTESFIVEETTVEPVAEPEAPVVQAPPIQSTSRWAEVLFGTKDEEDDK
jgi:hypothetical protein